VVPRKTVKDSLVGEEDEEWAWHPKSQSFFDRGSANYCGINAVLIEEEDHFCIWTGTTIGKRNMPLFKWSHH